MRLFPHIVAWVGLGLAGRLAAADAAEPERVTLQLKWLHQFQFAGYYAAEAKGFYREAGLEVAMREAVPGEDPVERVLAGQADYGVGTSELVLLRAQGKPVVALAVIYQHSPLVLLARRLPGVGDVHGLADKPLMIEPQSAELFAYFRNEGIDPKKLKIEHHTFRVEDLLAGRVAAMSAYATDEPFQLRQAGAEYLVLTPRSGGIDFYGDNLFTTEREVRAHPERVRKFRAASLRGWAYALEHREELVDLILRRYGNRKSRAHLLFEAEQTAQLMHPGLIEPGYMNAGRWRHIAETYAEFGMVPRGFSPAAMIYEAEPRPDLRWLYWSLGGVTVLAVAGFGWALPLRRLNRRLARSERELRALAENAPFPVAITDLETGRVTFGNRRALELFGVDPQELLGMHAASFYRRPEDRERLIAALRDADAVTGQEMELRTKDERPIWVLMSAGRAEFEGRAAVVVAFHDMTQRRASEAELLRAKVAAETADAAKGRYLAVLSHEVRTPLQGMLGLIRLLRPEPLSADGREHLAICEKSGEALLKLVTDLLDFAQFDAGRVALERQTLAPGEFLRELCALFRPAAEAKAVALRYEVRPEVPALLVTDASRLRQILSNLLANALKFTAAGSVSVVAERVGAGTGGPGDRCRVRIHVSDTGAGIAPERLPSLFEPQPPGENGGRRGGSSGLGLSISRRLAQPLGGSLGAQSAPGAGSTFTVEIEAEIGAAPGGAAPAG